MTPRPTPAPCHAREFGTASIRAPCPPPSVVPGLARPARRRYLVGMSQPPDKSARLAAALRANLARRKAQTRARREAPDPAPPEQETPAPPATGTGAAPDIARDDGIESGPGAAIIVPGEKAR